MSDRVQFIGPFEYHRVVVDGWQVPLLEAYQRPNETVTVLLDQRYALDLSLDDADRVVPFIANAIAIALGFSAHPSHGEELNLLPPMAPRRMVRLEEVPTQ